jgi:hypothetical protein
MMQTVQVVRKGERPIPPPGAHAMLLAPEPAWPKGIGWRAAPRG